MSLKDQPPLLGLGTAATTRPDDLAVALFALSSIRGVGFGTIKALCEELRGDLTKAFKSPDDEIAAILYDARTPNPSAVIAEIRQNGRTLVNEGRKAWAKYQSRGVTLVFRGQEGYPDALLSLPSPPTWLFIEGDAALLHSPFLVGFVGTRSPSLDGEVIARRAASALATMGAVILSGLAEGIDAWGHQTALVYGAPTVAILGHGIDVVFPASTAKMRKEIVQFGGAVVSEYLPADNYSRDKFVHRNRIQAALSKAVCFVEAREKSGTAHTLRYAQSLGRQVFGVTMGGYRGVPEEELVHVLESSGGEVFDVADERSNEKMADFVHRAFTAQATVPEDDAPRMFRNIAREVRRTAEEYGATWDDIEWLQREIGKVAPAGSVAKADPAGRGRNRSRRSDANQSRNP